MADLEEYTGKRVTFLCTSYCNVNCKHCYVSYEGKRDPMELLEIVKKMKNEYKIMLNGAEILTDLEYLKSFKEIGQKWILTNGLMLTKDEVIDELINNEIKSVSMSYHFGIHDSISKVKISVLKNIMNKLKNAGLEYRILTTITSQNYQLVQQMCQESFSLGAKGIMFTNFIRQGNALNLDDNLILNSEQLQVFFESLSHVRSIYDKDKFVIERSGTFGKLDDATRDHFYCDAGTDRVYVTPDNKIYPCIFLTKPGFEIGEFCDGKLMVTKEVNNTHDKCLVKDLCNHRINE